MKTFSTSTDLQALVERRAPLDMSGEEFRRLGHRLVDQIAGFFDSIGSRQVTPAESVHEIRKLIRADRGLPESGTGAADLLEACAELLFDHSLHNGHPRFWGYVTSSAAPLGALADFLASSVNPNAGGWELAPVASEIELQTIRWIADLIRYPAGCGGLLVSGGNMANFIGILVGRRAKADWDVRTAGMGAAWRPLRIYTSTDTHTWMQKAADFFGFGTDSITWVPADSQGRLDPSLLRQKIEKDRRHGSVPFMVVATAGSVGIGAVDPLRELGKLCRDEDLWFHVDGAYGAFAAAAPDVPEDLRALSEADSVAMDPHKWLYAPLEAGCVLVRRPELLRETFSYHPPYYNFDPDLTNFFDIGPQNSRGFRALKVWLALLNVGREGYARMIADDIALAGELFRILPGFPELQRFTHNLSIVTFRFVPSELAGSLGSPQTEEYLDTLNREILNRVERSGEAFVSNAVVGGRFALRMCIVNFRTSLPDIQSLPETVIRHGRKAHAELRV